jgi:hypothetical protein
MTPTSRPADIDELRRQAMAGNWTKEAAENISHQLFGRPLAVAGPDVDPTEMLDWNLFMVLAWIIWRDPAKVAKFAVNFRQNSYEWVGNSLCRLGAPSLFHVWELMKEVDETAPRERLDKAIRTLLQALRSGMLTATASVGGVTRTVFRSEWQMAEIGEWNFDNIQNRRVPGQTLFSTPDFPREAVIERWPPDGSTPDRRAVGKKTSAVHEAIERTWPNGVPETMGAKDRNATIRAYLSQNAGIAQVSDDIIERVLRKIRASLV